MEKNGFRYSMSKKELLSLASKAFGIAYEHGLHDSGHSNMHWLMLCVSEIGEMVEADRKSRHADVDRYVDERKFGQDVYDKDTRTPFEKYVKDTFEDEMADVFIRILDFASAIGVEKMLGSDVGIIDMSDEFKELFGGYTNAERCFFLTKMLCEIDEHTSEEEVASTLSRSLSFILEYARFLRIDLRRHISLKMQYNALRPPLNGKLY